MWRRILLFGVGGFLAIQLVPYGWRHPNPPVTEAKAWPSAEVEAIARESCYACHSNETRWPVYSYIAPMSWLVRSDVEKGREELNWSTGEFEDDDSVEAIESGEMPPSKYTLLHPGARLSDKEKAALIAALQASDGEDHSGHG